MFVTVDKRSGRDRERPGDRHQGLGLRPRGRGAARGGAGRRSARRSRTRPIGRHRLRDRPPAAPGARSGKFISEKTKRRPAVIPVVHRGLSASMIRDWSNFIADRTAIVTGSGGGVGRAIAIQMARAGADAVDQRPPRGPRREGRGARSRRKAGSRRRSSPTSAIRDEVARMVERDRPGRHPREQRGDPARGHSRSSRSSTPARPTGTR